MNNNETKIEIVNEQKVNKVEQLYPFGRIWDNWNFLKEINI